MSNFGQDFLKGVTKGVDLKSFGKNVVEGFIGNDVLRDYTHASKTFRTNAYELKPRFKFLFHVQFTLNVDEIQVGLTYHPGDSLALWGGRIL